MQSAECTSAPNHPAARIEGTIGEAYNAATAGRRGGSIPFSSRTGLADVALLSDTLDG